MCRSRNLYVLPQGFLPRLSPLPRLSALPRCRLTDRDQLSRTRRNSRRAVTQDDVRTPTFGHTPRPRRPPHAVKEGTGTSRTHVRTTGRLRRSQLVRTPARSPVLQYRQAIDRTGRPAVSMKNPGGAPRRSQKHQCVRAFLGGAHERARHTARSALSARTAARSTRTPSRPSTIAGAARARVRCARPSHANPARRSTRMCSFGGLIRPGKE